MIADQTNIEGNEASLTSARRALYFALPVLLIVGALGDLAGARFWHLD